MNREELIDFDKYVIKEDGSIFSKHWGKQLLGWEDKDGYLVSCLTLKNGKRQPYRVNRVIAYLFVPRPQHLKDIPYEELQVGHNDTNKLNNNASNLYWCTSKENNNNPITKEKQIGKEPWNKGVKNCFSEEVLNRIRIKNSIPIKQCSLDDVLIKEWESATAAGKELGICATNITQCLRKIPNHKTAGGFRWEYA